MSEEKLSNLKCKLKKITELIDQADQRKVDAKHSFVEAAARLEKSEGELSSSARRIQLIKKELDDAAQRLKVAEDKLTTAESTTEEYETRHNELDEIESAQDEKIGNLEEQSKEAKRTLESNETKYIEAERKIVVISRDTEKVKVKADALEKRVALLEETISSAGQSLQELEEREGESSEREELNDEKLRFLEGQFKDAEVRAEAAERSCGVMERNILETENEINTWIQKRETIENEMKDMDAVADEDDIPGLRNLKDEASEPESDLASKFGGRVGSSFIPPTTNAAPVTPIVPPVEKVESIDEKEESEKREEEKRKEEEEEESSEEESEEESDEDSDFDI